MKKDKLAVVTTHPIQYNAPLFALLTERGFLNVKVFYTWGEGVLENKYDPGFKRTITWDVPLLTGYEYQFENNVAEEKGSHHFSGIDCPGLITSITEFGPHAILIYGWSYKAHLAALKHFHEKIPIIFRGDSHLLDKRGAFATLRRRLFLTWLYRLIDVALYTGKNNYDYYRWCLVQKRKLVFGPHSVDNSRFTCKDEPCINMANGLRDRLQIPHGATVFLFAGKLEDKKAPGFLLQAFLSLKTSDDTFLVIVGNGPLEAVLKEKYSGHERVRFLDFQNQSVMPAIYKMADVFVLPSNGPGETWGLSVNEAMSIGKPVIVSDKCGCAADLVHQGKNGFRFKSGDVEELRRCMQNMLTIDRQSMSRMSLEIIKDYSFEKLALAVENAVAIVSKKRRMINAF